MMNRDVCYNKDVKNYEVMTMKKLFLITIMAVGVLAVSGCDIIQEEIERAESIEFEDIKVDLENRDVYLKITSDADEQVIEDMVVNGETYELTNEGDDWYLLDEVPIEKSYVIDSVYYRTGIGMRLSFDLDYSATLSEVVDELEDEALNELGTDDLVLGEYTFKSSQATLATVENTQGVTIDKLADWLWVITEDGVPEYVIFEDDATYVAELPEEVEDYLK